MEKYIHARTTRANSSISITETPIDPITPDNDEELPIIFQYDQESPRPHKKKTLQQSPRTRLTYNIYVTVLYTQLLEKQ